MLGSTNFEVEVDLVELSASLGVPTKLKTEKQIDSLRISVESEEGENSNVFEELEELKRVVGKLDSAIGVIPNENAKFKIEMPEHSKRVRSEYDGYTVVTVT